MKKSKLKVLIIAIVTFLVILSASLGFYFWSLTGYNTSEEINFTVSGGKSKIEIAEDLKTAGLVKSKFTTLIYLFFHNDLTLQAGTYSFNRNMGVSEIVNKISRGEIKLDSIKITFVEGKNINDYISLIAKSFSIEEEQVKLVLENKEFIQELVSKYDFLTESVLNDNIYYALEGYLFPDTYEFSETVSIEDVIIRMLDNTKEKLSGIEINSDYSIHEILTMASIAELEAVNENDRKTVAQVIYKRLNLGMSLGMDVTTYYAVGKKLGIDELTVSDLNSSSLYNTRNPNLAGLLPVGPICNPSLESINAVLNPSDTDYIYFYADVRTHEVFFANTYEDFLNLKREIG